MLIKKDAKCDFREFTEEKDPAKKGHPGSTSSYKPNLLGEANIQITFHENDRDGNAIKAELDIDFFSDPLSHFFLEVVPNKITGGKTDPKTVYVLPWMAALRKGISVRRTGLPDFYAERSDSQWNAALQDSTRKTIEHFGGAGRWWLSS